MLNFRTALWGGNTDDFSNVAILFECRHRLRLERRAVATEDFFVERQDQSEVKSQIVVRMFDAWSNIVGRAAPVGRGGARLAYIDLYAGPGLCEDGSKSTPLLILEQIIAKPELAKATVTMFNDVEPDHCDRLIEAIDSLPGIESLRHKPSVSCGEIDQSVEQHFANAKLLPTFSFLDPFGYKGLTVGLIKALAKDWGSDCIFFFNYLRINAAITNDAFKPHMEALFGVERLSKMRADVARLSPWQRVEYAIDCLKDVLRSYGLNYSLAFKFKNDAGTRVTHAIVYVTKRPKGFRVMRDIMAKLSSTEDHGVPSYTYCPAEKLAAERAPELDFANPIDDLAQQLLKMFAGRTLTVEQLLDSEECLTNFTDKNYKEAVVSLEIANRISGQPSIGSKGRPTRSGKPTCGSGVVLTFPPEK